MKTKPSFSLLTISVIVLILAAIVLYSSSSARMPESPVNHGLVIAVFIVDILCIAGIVAAIGIAVTGSPTGIAINGVNQYSLSRLQMTAWTIVILAGVLIYATLNVFDYFGPVARGALDISIPTELLEAMGIAVFTTGAVPAILSFKESQPDATDAVKAVAKKRFSRTTGTPTSDIDVNGVLMSRTDRDRASWIDMVIGDEVANAGQVDISKVQQLLITLLLVGVYVGAIIAALAKATPETSKLPDISQTFINLLALSHAGYLGYKIAPKAASDTDTTPPDTANAPVPDGKTTILHLTINDAASVTGLNLLVDGTKQPVDPAGTTDLTLANGADHAIAASGTRNGTPVNGTLQLTASDLTGADLVKAVDLTPG